MRLEDIAALCDLAVNQSAETRWPKSTWGRLFSGGLVHEHPSTESPYSVSERGRAFLDHLETLPLPEQTVAWRMPGHETSATAWIAPVFEDEGKPPPAPPLRRKRVIPTDPEELRQEAVRLMDAGYGMNEVKEQLELTEPQAQQFFFGK